MKFIKKLAAFLFGIAIEPKKEELKHKIDQDSQRTNSEFVKKRNEVKKLLLDMVDEKAVNDLMDMVDNKIHKK